MAHGVPDGLLRHPPDQGDDVVGRPLHAARPTPTSRSPPRRPTTSDPPGPRPARRRSARADGSRPAASAAAAASGAASRLLRSARSRSAGGTDGSRAVPESANAVPASSCTTPSWRSRAIRRRSASDASTARCISRSRAREARVSRRVSTPSRGTPSSSKASSAPAVMRRNGVSTSHRALLHRLDRVVGLEEQRLSLRRLDLRVDLEESLLLVLELVLPPPQVRQSALGVAAVQDAELLVVEREPLSDQLGLVAVDDRAVRTPDLDPAYVADDQPVEHLTVEAVDGTGVARRPVPSASPARRPSGPAPPC